MSNCLKQLKDRYSNSENANIANRVISQLEGINNENIPAVDKQAKMLTTAKAMKIDIQKRREDYVKQQSVFINEFQQKAINGSPAAQLLSQPDTPTNPNPLSKFAPFSFSRLKQNILQWFANPTDALTSKGISKITKDLTKDEKDVLTAFVARYSTFNDAVEKVFKVKDNVDFRYEDLIQFTLDENTDEDSPKLSEALKIAMHSAAMELLGNDMYKLTENSLDDIRRILGLDKEDNLSDAAVDILFDAGTKAEFLATDIGRKVINRVGINTNTDRATSISASQFERSIGLLVLATLEDMQILKRNEFLTGDGTGEYGLSGLANNVFPTEINNQGEEVYVDIEKSSHNSEEFRGKGSTVFFALNNYSRDEEWNLIIDDDALTESAYQYLETANAALSVSPNIIAEYLGQEQSERVVQWEQPEFTKDGRFRRTKKQKVKVSAEQTRNLETNERNSYELDETLSEIFESLEPEQANALIGIRDEGVGLKTKAPSVKGKNVGLQRELADYKSFLAQKKKREASGKNGKFFIKGEFWQVMRMGMKGLINPQMSKMHRSLFKMSGWDSTIDLDNSEHTDNFLSAVGTLVGIESGKLSGLQGQLSAVNDFFESDANNRIIHELIRKLNGEKLSAEENEIIVEGIKDHDDPMMVFKGFVEYAKYTKAKNEKQKSFVSSAQVEIDGIANGVIMAIIQLIPDSADKKHVMGLLKMGGYNFMGDDSNIDELLGQAGLQDAYMHMAQTMSKNLVAKRVELEKMVSEGEETGASKRLIYMGQRAAKDIAYMDHMSNILGSFTSTDGYAPKRMRSLVKYRIVSTIFGGSIYKQQQIFKGESIVKEGIEDNLQEVIKQLEQGDPTKSYSEILSSASVDTQDSDLLESVHYESIQKVTKLFSAINGIIDVYNENAEEEDQIDNVYEDENGELDGLFTDDSRKFLDIEKLSEIAIPTEVIDVLLEDGAKLYADAMGEAIEEEYASVIEARESFTSATNVMVTKYNTLLQAAFERKRIEIANSEDFKARQAIIDKANERRRANRIAKGQDPNDTRNFRPDLKPELTNKDIQDVINELATVLPKIKTLFYDEASDVGYLNLGKKQRRFEENTHANTTAIFAPKDIKRLNLTANEALPFLTPPGVAAILNMLHMLDGTVANKAIGSGLPILNNHDGLSTSIHHADNLNGILNTEHINAMRNFSLGSAVNESLQEFNKAYNAMAEQYDVTSKMRLDELIKSNALKHYFSVDFLIEHSDGAIYQTIQNSMDEGYSEKAAKYSAAMEYRDSIIEDMHLNSTDSANSIAANKALDSLFQSHDEYVNQTVQSMAKQTTENKDKVIGSVSSVNQYSYQGKPVPINTNVTDTGFIDTEGNTIAGADITQDTQSTSERVAAKIKEQVENYALGSSTQDVIEDENAYKRQQEVDHKNIVDVFDSLVEMSEVNKTDVADSATHKEYLQNLLRSMTTTIMKPLQVFSDQVSQDALGESKGKIQIRKDGANRIFIASKNTPNNSAVASLGIRMSTGEVYAHEVIHHVTDFGLSSNRFLYRQAVLLYNTARTQLTRRFGEGQQYRIFLNDPQIDVSDPANADEVQMAKERWDYIFNPEQSKHPLHEGRTTQDKTHNGISEFIAFGTTNQNMMNHLSNIDVSLESKKYRAKHGKLFEKNLQKTVLNFYNRIMSFIVKTSTNRKHGDNVRTELLRLTEALSKTNSGNKNVIWEFLMDKDKRANAYSAMADEYVKDKARRFAKKTGIGKIVNSVKTVPQLDNMASYQMRRIINWYNDGDYGFTSSVVTDLRGNTTRLRPFHDLLHRRTLLIDAAKQNKAEVVQDLVNSFTKKKLTDEEKVAATKALLKTDLSCLTKHSSISAIHGFMENGVFLQGRITALENQLKQDSAFSDSAHYFITQAETLGHFMVTGKGLEKGVVMQNANNIVNVFNTGYDITLTAEAEQKALDTVEQLATLYAIKYLPTDTKRTAANIFKDDLIALDKFMSQHTIFKEESAAMLFSGNKYGMAKGYTKTVTNPYLQFVKGSIKDKEFFASKGYVPYGSSVKRDIRMDNEKQDIIMYKSTLGSRGNYEAGIVSFTGLGTKGDSTLDIQRALRRKNPAASAEVSRDFAVQKVKEKLTALVEGTFVPANNNPSQMIPKFDEAGNIVDMRYIMSEHMKDTMLEQHSNIDYIMGNMFGDIIDKSQTPVINKEVLQALHTIFTDEYTKYPTNFVEISRYAKDERHRSIYAMLPTQTKLDLKAIWGSNKMYVPKDVLDLAFGSRKYDITESLLKDPIEQGKFEQAISAVTKFTLGFSVMRKGDLTNKTGLAITRAKHLESAIEQVVGVIKDNIVVRNIKVTRGNYASNIAQLRAEGIDIDFITTHTKAAITSALAYQQAKRKLDILEEKRNIEMYRTKYNTADKRKRLAVLDRKIVQVQDLLSRNPSTPMMEMGLMPAIVDDITTEVNLSPFKTGLDKTLDKVYAHTPEKLAVAGKVAFLTKDSEGYRVLNNAVKLTDYVGRYVMYKHYKEQGINHADALSAVNEKFINFELPTHRMIDYGNRLGLIWFSKYQLRVLKQIGGLLKEKPVTSMITFLISSAVGTSNIFNSVPGVTKGLFQMFSTPDALLIDSFKNEVLIDTVSAPFE